MKPFSPREIVSRIQVIFRRMNQMQSAPDQGRLEIGNTVIDLKCYEVRVKGDNVLLSPKEVEILHLMASHPRQVFTREQLLDNIWGFDFNGDPRVVDTSIKRIRKKLPEGFQRAEFLLEHGFIDLITPRSRQREVIARLLRLHNEGKQDACVQQADAGETKEDEA